jgi:DNA-directed RNA polymerase subunit N
LELIEKGESAEDAFKELGIERFCCKRMIVSHVDLIDELLKFPRLQ